jgi:hypothetical protein
VLLSPANGGGAGSQDKEKDKDKDANQYDKDTPWRVLVGFVFFSSPLCLRRGAQSQTDQGRRLSERSEFEPDPGWIEHRRLPRSEALGTQAAGSPFLCLLSFGEAKESELPPGNPRHQAFDRP